MKKLSLWLLALLLLLTGCDDGRAAGRQPTLAGTRRQPFEAGDVAIYEGLDKSTEYGSFRLQLQLLDAVRGYPALQIYLADSGTNRETDIPPGKELVLAKLSAELLESQDDMPLSLGTWAEDMFLMVAERGQTYEPFSTYGRLSGHLFGVLEPGERQEGIVGFVVDEWDDGATVVFMPTVNSGLWFDPAIAEEQRGQNRIDPSDWGLDEGIYDPYHSPGSLPDAADAGYGGTLAHPLPPGEWGVYNVRGGDAALELELMLLETERGDRALARLGRQADPLLESMDAETQELLAIHLQANLLRDTRGAGVGLTRADFLVRRDNGELLRQEHLPELSPDSAARTMFAGATQEGWVYYVVDKGENLLLTPYYSEGAALWYTTDPDAQLPEELERFASRYTPDMASAHDYGALAGSLENPTVLGEAGRYVTGTGDEVDIRVVEMLRGAAAEERLDPIEAAFWQPPPGGELLCARVELTLLYSDGPDVVELSAADFGLVSSRRIAGEPALDAAMALDGIGPVAVGQTVQGDLLFVVDAADPAPLLCVSTADGAPQWFALSAYGPALAI